MICEHHKELRDAGVRAIADASSVGQAFDAKGYFLKSAKVLRCRPSSKIRFSSRCREGNSFLPKIEVHLLVEASSIVALTQWKGKYKLSNSHNFTIFVYYYY